MLQVGALERSVIVVGFVEIGAFEIGLGEIGFSEHSPAQVRPAEIGPAEIDVAQVSPFEVGVGEVGHHVRMLCPPSTLDKLLSSRRIKKQDAALKRFEKDRKAWNEDRDYALGIYEKAKAQHDETVTQLEATYEAALGQWKNDFEAYLSTLAHRAA